MNTVIGSRRKAFLAPEPSESKFYCSCIFRMYCQTSQTATSSFAHRGLSLSNTCATNRFLGVDSKFEIPKILRIFMNWRVVLAVLTCSTVLMSASYTMLIPFLPMYLIQELGVQTSEVNWWSSIIFAVSFLISGIFAPIWGAMSDKGSRKLMALHAPAVWQSPTFWAPSSRPPGNCSGFAYCKVLPLAYGRLSWPF